MVHNKQGIDMLHGRIWTKVLRFALPVAATGILEQLFNASGIMIVGNFSQSDGTAAVAAVGSNAPVTGLILNLFIGIALGANVVIANAIGRGSREAVRNAVHTSIVTALIGGVIVAIIGELLAGPLLGMLNVTADVFPLALAYLRIYLIGMPVHPAIQFRNSHLPQHRRHPGSARRTRHFRRAQRDHGTDFRRIVPLGCFGRRDGHSHRERRQLHDSAVSTGSY